jgi:glycosyltransferase involved in cell wall biosynthesis
MQPHGARTELVGLPLRHRVWRTLPPVLRRRALARASAIIAPRPGAAPVAPGLVIAGEMLRPSGLGEGARLMEQAARRMGLPVWGYDLPALAQAPVTGPLTFVPPGVPLVVHVNAPMLPLALLRLPGALTRHRRIIGYWAWELPSVPPEWRPALACVDEVWVPSAFTEAALSPLLPNRVRVVPPPLADAPPVPSARTRAGFGLPEDAVVVLVSFNLASSLARKNPFAAIAAFRTAFGDRPDRVLVLKVGHPDHAPEDFAALAALAQAPNIVLIPDTLSAPDRHALTACADIVLSLHRSEGFGLVLAEAMLLAKPVIATGWSGNTGFMNAANAALVGHRLVPARDDRQVYRGSRWAEPDTEHAVMWLRHLADNPVARHVMGQRAQQDAGSLLTSEPLRRALGGLGMALPA